MRDSETVGFYSTRFSGQEPEDKKTGEDIRLLMGRVGSIVIPGQERKENCPTQ